MMASSSPWSMMGKTGRKRGSVHQMRNWCLECQKSHETPSNELLLAEEEQWMMMIFGTLYFTDTKFLLMYSFQNSCFRRYCGFVQPSNVVVKGQQLVIMKKRTSFPTAIHQASKPGNKKRCQAECQKRHHKLPFGMSAIETLFWPYCIPFFIFHKLGCL